MLIAVARESDAASPASPLLRTPSEFIALGATVAVARGAGIPSGIADADYAPPAPRSATTSQNPLTWC